MPKDLQSLSSAELEAMMDGKTSMDSEETATDTAKAEVDAVPEKIDAKPDPEPEPEKKPAEPEPEKGKADDDLTEEQIARKLLESRLEEALATARKNESLAGRNAGENGFLRQQLKAMAEKLDALTARRSPDDSEADGYDERPAPRRREPSQPARGFDMEEWARNRAIKEAGAEFASAHQDFAEHRDHIRRYIAENGLAITDDMSPLEAERETTRVLSEAYWDSRAARQREIQDGLKKREADQFNGMREAKRRATISGTGATPAPAPKEKTLDEMSVDELSGMLDTLVPPRRANFSGKRR